MVRKWLYPRALLWHALMVGIVTGCLYAGWWQVHRAMAGNTLSYLYSVEWPVFAIVAVVGWWQLIQEDPAEVEARKEERRRRGRANPIAYDQDALRSELAAHPELVRVFPELVKAFPELVAGRSGPAQLAASVSGEAVAAGRCGEEQSQDAAGVEVLPAGARAGGRSLVVREEATGEGDPAVASGRAGELRAYNDRLAQLAARGKAKTWRNPYGR